MSPVHPADPAAEPGPAAAGVDPGPDGGDTGSGHAGRRSLTPYLLLLPGIGWLVAFFLVPMVTLFSTSLQEGSLETGYRLTFRWENYTDSFTTYAPWFGRSFLYAGLATLLALLISYPLAYAIAFKAGRWKNLLLVLVIAPFFTSFLVRTLAWTSILADNGALVGALRTVGLLGDDGRLLFTPLAVITGLTYNFLPFMILPLYASLDRLDWRLIEAAGDLYASAFTAFRKVTLPLSLPGVVAGTLLTFIPAAGDFINAQLLGTPKEYMIGNVINSQFLVRLDYPTASALSFMFMAAILVMVFLYIRYVRTEELF